MEHPIEHLLRECREIGVTLAVQDGNLLYYPRPLVDERPDLRARLVAHKEALLYRLEQGGRVGTTTYVETSGPSPDSRDDIYPEAPSVSLDTCEPEMESAPDIRRSRSPEDQELIAWFHDRGRDLVPSESFELHRGVSIVDPELFVQRLLRDIERGPDGPRARYGALSSDLKRLRNLLKGRCPSTEATPANPNPTDHGEGLI